jgi:hypothetical protein
MACAVAVEPGRHDLAGPALSAPAPNFVAESVVSGLPFTVPTTLALLPDDRLLVGEKRARCGCSSGVAPAALWDGENGCSTASIAAALDRGRSRLREQPPPVLSLRWIPTVTVDSNEDAFGRLTRYTLSATD